MPVVSMFFGIVIKMYYREEHGPAHFHAEYQGFAAFFDINTGELISGKFPKKAQSIIKEWTKEHSEELLENWQRARKNERLFGIEGADQ